MPGEASCSGDLQWSWGRFVCFHGLFTRQLSYLFTLHPSPFTLHSFTNHMARVPFIDDIEYPELKPLADRIRTERGGRLYNLYKVLLNNPRIAEGWLALFTAIRQQSELGGRYRELAIMLVAVINRAEYEYVQHVPFALKAGLTQAQLDALRDWRNSELFQDADRAVLEYTEAMTRSVQVPDEVFAAVARHFDARQTVELTATVAGYNLVSRFLEALKVDHE
jgi:alkylhydroperoxidase family enzyme